MSWPIGIPGYTRTGFVTKISRVQWPLKPTSPLPAVACRQIDSLPVELLPSRNGMWASVSVYSSVYIKTQNNNWCCERVRESRQVKKFMLKICNVKQTTYDTKVQLAWLQNKAFFAVHFKHAYFVFLLCVQYRVNINCNKANKNRVSVCLQNCNCALP